jgi:phosphate transport system protein
MSKHFERQIEKLKLRLISVGAAVEEAINKAVTALENHDGGLAQEVIQDDDQIDHAEVEVEEECLKLLALYQPVAADLRFVVAALKMNNDLERMGDLAANVAKSVVAIGALEPRELPPGFRPMASKAQAMVRHSLDAVVNSDTALARQVLADDDAVDALRREVRDAIYDCIRREPERVKYFMKLMSAANQLERLGDTATNVAEDVLYMVEGEIFRHRTARLQEVLHPEWPGTPG